MRTMELRRLREKIHPNFNPSSSRIFYILFIIRVKFQRSLIHSAEIVLKNVRYGAYVTAYQEDATSDGIITPREARMQEHITISENCHIPTVYQHPAYESLTVFYHRFFHTA